MSAEYLPQNGLENPSLERSKRRLNPGAEKWIGVELPVLDHGFVQLVNYMGDDHTVEEAARVSYGEGTRKVSETKGLVRYLMRNQHTTPFEMCELTFRMGMPISVARQLIRHRTANVNEYSTRYSIVPDIYYLVDPADLGVQSSANRQGRGDVVDEEYAQKIRASISQNSERAFEVYRYILNDDGTGKPLDGDRPMIARETARDALSLNYYTQMYWKMDLHNIFHFLKLRMDKHAQKEIRQYANTISTVVKDAFPVSWNAFEDYELNAVYLSQPEANIITTLLKKRQVLFNKDEVVDVAAENDLTNSREQKELLNKLKEWGILENE